jgi:type IV pilus assembly protein PilY1
LDPGINLKPDFDLGATASKDLFNTGVNTFVIGFGKAAGANTTTLNNIARAGSNGVYDAFFTDTLAGLTNAIQTIFQIIGGSYARSSPVVSRNRDRLYRGYFNLPGYEGHLVAYDLNTDGTIKTPETWDAGKVMNSNGRSSVYTWVDGNFGKSKGDFTNVDFADKSGKKLSAYLNPSGEDINNDGKVDKKDSQTIVSFILNPNYDDGKNGPGYYKGVRSAKWLLGDIYHSTPLVVGAPNFNFPDAAFPQKYSDFKNTWKTRETVIYVGANDGMLHAFSDKDGNEKFGIIPNDLLGKLKELRTNSHQFLVDSSPRAYDVLLAGSWSTVIVSGERGGGNSYFALDVTDPKDANYPNVLWHVTDPGMGNTWSRPEIGWVRISGQEKFVAFVGGGYSTADDVGNTFYVIDMADGSILRKFIVGVSTNKVPAGATAFDSDLDGRVNGVYFGDMNGVLWKIKIDGEEDITKWQLINLNTPPNNSPVFYPPAVTMNNGKILVYYGQGNELNIFNVDNNSFFEIWDKGVSGVKNWEESLGAGEKVLAAPAIANNVVYFTTWKYTGDKTDCGAGKGRLYGLTISSAAGAGDLGALALDPLTGTDLGAKKKYFEITDYFSDSRGIPSAPIVTNGMIYLSTSLNADKSKGIPIPQWGGQMRLKKWREVF